MIESWRWFGPEDLVSLDDIRQTGVSDIVSALHHIPIGDVWPIKEIKKYQKLIEQAPSDENKLTWSIVESIPIHEDIKLGLPSKEVFIKNWIQTIENLSKCGIKTICYNFMPVLDWTRTDLKYKLSSGAYSLSFNHKMLAVFDLFILEREKAENDYSEIEISFANKIYKAMSDIEKETLKNNIISGLPGSMTESYTLNDFKKILAKYKNISVENLRDNLLNFLENVLPVCELNDVKLAIHPDDPPWNLFGLPRIISTKDDIEKLFSTHPSSSNGMTLCVGSYASRNDNNVIEIIELFSSRIYFAHLRNVCLSETDSKSFYESDHLDGDVDMVEVINKLLEEENQRLSNSINSEIFFRPDHGLLMMDDIKNPISNPGYSKVGRLKGLAELRGAIRALTRNISNT
ncbi:mannonate dehydratase [Gammaproteobacteria bacterium]|nr:mannonate dehydratase [Gammaproteobacteria bacterium]